MTDTPTQGRARPVGAVRALPWSQAPRAKKNKMAGQVKAEQVAND